MPTRRASAGTDSGSAEPPASGKPAKPVPDHARHRERLRLRFKEGGGAAFPDYELLEMILYRAIARQDTKALAKALLKEFKGFAQVLAAPEARLKEIDGVGDAVVHELKVIAEAARRITRTGIANKRSVLSSWSAVLDYCRATMAFADREQFRLLFLDKGNALIADEMQQWGTVDHTPVYPREVVKRALELSATSIIMVHNHPSGDPAPSRADVEMTKEVIKVAKPLGISVHDHIIVGRDGHASLKSLRLI